MEGENRIGKLKGAENWTTWKFQVTVTLKAGGAWEVVSGATPSPEKEDKAEQEIAVQAWNKKDNLAQRIIATTIEEKPLLHILNLSSSRDMWDRLVSVYEQKSESSVHMLLQQWYGLQKKPSDDIATHVAKLEDLAHRLETMGEKIPTQMVIAKILMTLPPSFGHFVSAWESTQASERTLTNLISRLTIEESRAGSNEKSDSTAFASDRRSSGNYKKFEKTGTCHFCHKKGHWIRDCRKRKMMGDRQTGDKGEALIGEVLTLAHGIKGNHNVWYMDSGATDHMTSHREWFGTFSRFKEPKPVRIGDVRFIHATGVGDVNILAYNGNDWNRRHLSNVLYVPKLNYNLFSSGAALDKGIVYHSDKSTCKFIKQGIIVAVGERQDKLFEMKFRVITEKESEANVATHDSLRTWHERLAHQNVAQVKKILKESNIIINDPDFRCENCIMGKMHRLPFPKSESRSKRAGELVHMDLCGPMQENSLGGARYFLQLKDDYSHWRTIYFIKQKSETSRCIEDFLQKGL